MVLAGDIGGTKTILAVFSPDSPDSGYQNAVAEEWFVSNDFPTLEAIIEKFIKLHRYPLSCCSFGVAGPVIDKRATLPNLPWTIDADQLKKRFGFSHVKLLNDLEAIVYSVPGLQKQDLYTLNRGKPQPAQNIAVIAPGTGLGEAFLTWDGDHCHAHASEGGHADFAPTNALQTDLLHYLLENHDHVSYENVCSGTGLPNIYNFFVNKTGIEEPSWLAEEISKAVDPTPLIINTALDEQKGCEICRKTMDTFVDILAGEAGNMALRIMATGGVYLGGGIPPRILPALKRPRFLQGFTQKGRMSELVGQIPVHVILNPKSALIGAAYFGTTPQ